MYIYSLLKYIESVYNSNSSFFVVVSLFITKYIYWLVYLPIFLIMLFLSCYENWHGINQTMSQSIFLTHIYFNNSKSKCIKQNKCVCIYIYLFKYIFKTLLDLCVCVYADYLQYHFLMWRRMFPFEKKPCCSVLCSWMSLISYTGRKIALQGKSVISNVHLLYSSSVSQYY